MLNTYEFGSKLKELGFTFYSGVPCSFLTSLINYAINDCNYVMASNEGEAVAICSGAQLAGTKSVALMQNSGLTNAVSPLTSLNYSFQLPILGFVSLRGESGLNDEPQHELMGQITEKMLELMKVEWEYLSSDMTVAIEQLTKADQAIANNKTFFFVIKNGTFDKVTLKSTHLPKIKNLHIQNKYKPDVLAQRQDVLKTLTALKDDSTILLATTGKAGRELYEIEDSKHNLYMVGSMGCISSLALGTALNTKKKIIAIDGDGAFLMRMGNLAANVQYAPQNFLHILIDNNVHDSTGGQFTLSHNFDFVQICAAAGYEQSIYVHSIEELQTIVKAWQKKPKMTFLYIKVNQGTMDNLGRPKVKPFEVKERLMRFIND